MSVEEAPAPAHPPARRILAVDVARGMALLAMASYHFAWDLEFFGYAPPGMTAFGGWKFYARCIASSFLFLVGVSLVLAHGRGIRWAGFGKRLAMIVAAAAAITAATFLATPDSFIFFGILHHIALASLLGLAFVRLPTAVTALAAVAVIAAPHMLRAPLFDNAALWWVGLSTIAPRSNDYVPLFPWFGAVLAGVAAARLAVNLRLDAHLAALPLGRWSRPLILAGQHSLAFYLVHQPFLIGCIWLFATLVPPQPFSQEQAFTASCHASCRQSRDAAFCSGYCDCMLGRLAGQDLLTRLEKGEVDTTVQTRVADLANTCTAETDEAAEGEVQ